MKGQNSMTPNQQVSTNTMGSSTGGGLAVAKTASSICLLAGIWLFVSPWVYGAFTNGNAWNAWIVGGLIILFGIMRILRPAYSTVLGWCNIILGIWTFFSPWIYGFAGTNGGRFINSLCVGVIVFVLAIVSVWASWNRNAPPANRTYTEQANAGAQSR